MVYLSKNQTPALLMVDIQKGIDHPGYYGTERNNPNAEKNIEKLLNHWRNHQLPVFHIKHCSTNPNSPLARGKVGNDFKDFINPRVEEPIIEKSVNSAFIDTGLRQMLEKQKLNTVVIVGLTTDHCISTTTRMAGNFGFNTFLVEDAVATFDKTSVHGKHYSAQLIHDTAIASLQNEFATIIATKTILNQLD